MATLGCQASQPSEPISESVLPIVGGTETTACQWPSAVMILGRWVCSGTLVHPRAVVTAKHCVMDETLTRISPPGRVGFGEDRDNWAKAVPVSTCHIHPSNDIALCILSEDVTDVPVVPIMAPCETTELLPGRPIVEVGFGVIGANDMTYGTKKWINGTIESRSASLVDILVTTGSQDGEYFGDSGGPLYFKMPDQTWRLIGEDCCSDDIGDAGPRISTYTSVPYHVAWMEEQSGLDLTPCHDQVGWSPGASCTGAPTNPGTGVGTWASSCQGQTMVRAQTCTTSPYDAGTKGDAREAGTWDGSFEARDAPMPDLRVGDSSADFPVDGLGFTIDSLDTQSDGWDTEPVVGTDSAIPDTRMDAGEPADSAPDTAPIPADTGIARLDTGAHEVGFDVAEYADARVPADTGADANRSTDGTAVRLVIRGEGCSCRTGAARSAEGWPMLVSFGLVCALGHSIRRRARRRFSP
jgi:hypothetical protein